MPLPNCRPGSQLRINDQVIDFSYYPMRRTTRRWGTHSMLYAADPWAVIAGAIRNQVGAGPDREAALSFVRQANEYYSAADRSAAPEPRPLLYYYAFLNLGKALGICRGRSGLVGRVMHGVSVDDASGYDLRSSQLQVHAGGGAQVNALAEFHEALTETPMAGGTWAVDDLAAQSVVAHRMWRQVSNRRERFLAVDLIELMHDDTNRAIWPRVRVKEDDLADSLLRTLNLSGLAGSFVRTADRKQSLSDGTYRRWFELEQPIVYTDRAADRVMDAVSALKPWLWRTVGAAPPYRRYYLYLHDGPRVPQLISIYALMFWLGSLTRYRPVELLALLDGPYGPFVREFLATQPAQFLYEAATEFQRQEVSRAAVV